MICTSAASGTSSSSGRAAIPGIPSVDVKPSSRAASSTAGVLPARTITVKGVPNSCASASASASCVAAASVSTQTPFRSRIGKEGKAMKV